MINIKEYSRIRFKDFVAIILFLTVNIFLIILFPQRFQIRTLAIFSVLQLIINCAVVLICCKGNIIPFLFLLFSWIFHCGQIIKYGFNIPGEVPLPFYNYGTEADFLNAFIFYFISQITLTIGCLIGFRKGLKVKNISSLVNLVKLAITLILIGIIPRIYIDLSRLRAALQNGYSGAYSLIFPSIFNTMAFLCDVGCFLFLYSNRKKRGNNVFFVVILLYKLTVMLSGMRQNPFCFLIVWVIFYFWYIQRIKFFQKLLLCLIAFIAVIFIDFIGSVRAEGFSFEGLENVAILLNNSLIGDTLGEFGSGFCSLVIAIHGFPKLLPFGYGKTYLAAIMSAIPKLLDLFPDLKECVTFTTLFSNTTYLGGSYLGEFYYNFSWLGMLGPLLVGYIIGKCQHILTCSKDDVSIVWYVALLIQLILFIRGYIADMAQTSIWLWLIIWLYKLMSKEKQKKAKFLLRSKE